MHSIFTDRLILHPLTLDQLQLINQGRNVLEKEMGLTLSDFSLNADESFLEEFAIAIGEYVILKVRQNPDHWIWYSHWLVIHRELNLTIGGIGGNGLPDAEGQVMIGYFIDQKFEGQGFATEALAGLLTWMKQHPDLKSVIADTYADNNGSQEVLKRNGFVLEGPSEEGLRWRYTF